MTRIIITGDDFGLTSANNAGTLLAHQDGALACTCLMVGGDAADEAVDIARRHPTLAVGLHVALSDARPALPPEQVPLLVQSDGRFPPDDHAHQSALWSVNGRRQMRAEIAAQFAKFHATGLRCDHVNTHRHVHMRHPLFPLMLFAEARKWRVKAVRVSCDPAPDAVRYTRNLVLRHVAHLCGLKTPDRTIGLTWTAKTLVDLVPTLPGGVTELYFHPTTDQANAYASDLPTLLDPQVKAILNGLTLKGLSI